MVRTDSLELGVNSVIYSSCSISRLRLQSKLQGKQQHCKCAHMISINSTAGEANRTKFGFVGKRLPNQARQFVCLTSTDFLHFTVITMLYFAFLLPAFGLVAAAPTAWSNACGIYAASADEQLSYEPLRGAEKNRVFCELRGNLTKQMNSLRRYMGPKNFSKVWAKHNKSYAFLAVARGKNITLRKWHKQLQVFVAAADHLYERAYNYKMLQQTAWVSSREQTNKAEEGLNRLRHFIITTRGILCELEVTANLLAKHRPKNKTIAIPNAVMNDRIKQLRSDMRTNAESVDPIDINMLYQRLRRSLLIMRKALKIPCSNFSRRAKRKKQHDMQGHGNKNQHKQSRKHNHKNSPANRRRKSHRERQNTKHTLNTLGQTGKQF